MQVRKILLNNSTSWNTACRRSHRLECSREEYSLSNRWRGDRCEGGWWGRGEGTRDDQHVWELFEFLLQHQWTCPHLALEAQTTISGNTAEVMLTKMVLSIYTTSANRSPTQHDTRCLPSGWSQTILDLEVLGWCGYTRSVVVRLPNSLKCLWRQLMVEKWPFNSEAIVLVDVPAVSVPTAHSLPCHICGIVLCDKKCTFSSSLVAWAAWHTPMQ